MTKHYLYDAASSKEILSDEFRALLRGLNEIVVESGAPLEGNLFFLNHRRRETPVDSGSDVPDPIFWKKRVNFSRISREKQKVVEIGFNAGHSALLALMSNPKLSYIGIDIARHAYTKPCAEFLAQKFPGRVEVVFGDSARVFPLIALDRLMDCDLIHIDGGHSLEMFTVDISHAIMLLNPQGVTRHVLIDDARATHIGEKIEQLCAVGFMQVDSTSYPWRGKENLLLKINNEPANSSKQ